jgi:hypothetical protein
MEFDRWYPLASAELHAPSGPGVFQVRIRTGLVDYPRGRSAMVHYGAADNVRVAVRAFANEHPQADWLCRHLLEGDGAGAAEAVAARLIRNFAARFGRPPTPP